MSEWGVTIWGLVYARSRNGCLGGGGGYSGCCGGVAGLVLLTAALDGIGQVRGSENEPAVTRCDGGNS